MEKFSWRNHPELMARLGSAQNHPANVSQDIMTFAGFCDSEAELALHVSNAEQRIANYVAPVRRRRAA